MMSSTLRKQDAAQAGEEVGVTPEPGDTYVQSFARGLAVIRSFDAQAPTQSLSEVAARTGLSRAGARRILLTLEHVGYVQSDNRQFRLTPKILDLGFAYLSSQPLWQVAEPAIEALVAEVKESSSVAVLDEGEIIYVMRVPTHKIISINLGIGSRLPAHCTSLGRVLLSGLSDAELAARLKRYPPRAYTDKTITEDRALVTAIRQVGQKGWSLVNQELEAGLVSIAAPIVDRSGRTVAALNVSGQHSRTPPKYMREHVLPRLQQTSNEISKLLQMRT
jgi:IclR family transcriptional regulator, pca regulon regulatory protein